MKAKIGSYLTMIVVLFWSASAADAQYKYRLLVQVTPQDSIVRIMNIKPAYAPNMLLSPGRYHLLVTRSGYGSYSKWIDISNSDVTLNIALKEKMKLLVDDGKYVESGWTRQIAITADDKFLLVSDFDSGVKIFEMATGDLINSFEGHSLEGDSYFDRHNNVLVTTGDRKIKVWDITKQNLEKIIYQDFHSQFMNNVYIDSGRKYVFAQNVKYDYATKAAMKKYTFERMYFYQDNYFIFNNASGTITSYDSYTDKRAGSVRIQNYKKGSSEYFNYYRGLLFLGYSNGIAIVDIRTGRSDIALFDRKNTYSNLGENVSYDISHTGKFLVAGSNQAGGHLVVFRKQDAAKDFWDNSREVYREKIQIGEVACLNTKNQCVITTQDSIRLFDLNSLKTLWQKETTIANPDSIYLSEDGRHLKINFGEPYGFHVNTLKNMVADEREFNRLFTRTSGHTYTFKADLSIDEIPEALRGLWKDRSRSITVDLRKGLSPIDPTNSLRNSGNWDMGCSPIQFFRPSTRSRTAVNSATGKSPSGRWQPTSRTRSRN